MPKKIYGAVTLAAIGVYSVNDIISKAKNAGNYCVNNGIWNHNEKVKFIVKLFDFEASPPQLFRAKLPVIPFAFNSSKFSIVLAGTHSSAHAALFNTTVRVFEAFKILGTMGFKT